MDAREVASDLVYGALLEEAEVIKLPVSPSSYSFGRRLTLSSAAPPLSLVVFTSGHTYSALHVVYLLALGLSPTHIRFRGVIGGQGRRRAILLPTANFRLMVSLIKHPVLDCFSRVTMLVLCSGSK